MYVTESSPSRAKSAKALSLPSDALQEAMGLWGLQLTLTAYCFSVTHTVHTPTPSPSCSQNGYGGEHKALSVYP